ncbi:MAG: potassium transporter TrkG [Wolbachia sp.]
MHGTPVLFAITSCAWIALSLFAASPFYLDSLDYVDVLFETTSCFTTTGATVFSDVEKLSPGILLWRAIFHGIGGFGIIPIGIGVFPMLSVLSISNLLYFEYSDITKRRLSNTRSVVIHATAIYYGLILLCIFSYYLPVMTLFNAICHRISVVSTGGFANYNDSIGHYNNPLLEVITIIFMILCSLPFLSYLKIIRQLDIYRDEQGLLLYWDSHCLIFIYLFLVVQKC